MATLTSQGNVEAMDAFLGRLSWNHGGERHRSKHDGLILDAGIKQWNTQKTW